MPVVNEASAPASTSAFTRFYALAERSDTSPALPRQAKHHDGDLALGEKPRCFTDDFIAHHAGMRQRRIKIFSAPTTV